MELVILLAGTYSYAIVTKAKNKMGKWMLWTVVILLAIGQLADTFGPTPYDSVMKLYVSFIIFTAIISTLVFWIDRNGELA